MQDGSDNQNTMLNTNAQLASKQWDMMKTMSTFKSVPILQIAIMFWIKKFAPIGVTKLTTSTHLMRQSGLKLGDIIKIINILGEPVVRENQTVNGPAP